MNHLRFFGWASLILIVLLSSCREEIIVPDKTINVPGPIVLVETSLRGQVIDENNNPVADVSIRVRDTEVTTDENGFFSIVNADLNKNGAHVTAEKYGYFFSSKMYNPSVGSESFLLFQLLDKQVTGTFVAANGGEIITEDDASIVFGSNSIMYENGTTYEGEVTVSAKYLDPTHELIAARMPGDLRAIDSDEELVQLATYGMLVVELEAPNGAPLQIKEANTATISLPLAAELTSVAPGTIPLWSFDEETGYWIEESTATLQAGKYIGEVSHFSYWNCDAPFPVIQFDATVLDANSDPINWIQVNIGNDGVGVRYAWTNDQGQVNGKIPSGEVLTLEIVDNCMEVIYSTEIGPFNADVILDPIQVDIAIPSNIIGNLITCDGSPVTNGYAIIDGVYYDEFLELDENGNFSKNLFACGSSDLTILGYDLDEVLKSDPVTMMIPVAGGTIDFPDIEVCQAITDLIHVSIPELSYEKDFIIYDAFENLPGGTVIQSELDSAYFDIYLLTEPLETGSVGIVSFNLSDWEALDAYIFCQGICPDFEITVNNGSGGLFEGSTTAFFDAETSGPITEYEVTIEVSVYLE